MRALPRWLPLALLIALAAMAPARAQGADRARASGASGEWPGGEPAAWRGDVRFLRAALDSLHPRPYRLLSRGAWDSAAADLERRLPALRHHQAVAELSRFVALLGDGHSRLAQLSLAGHARPTLAPLPGPGFERTYPIECEVFADGLRVIGATPAHANLLGARVTAIGGRPVADAIATLAPFIPADNPMWTLYVAPVFLRSPAYLAAAGLVAEPAAPLRLALVDRKGHRRNVTVTAGLPAAETRWIGADTYARGPLPLTRALPGPYAWADLDDSLGTVFVRVRAIVNEPAGDSLSGFVERLFEHVDAIGSRRLVLDLRGNGGGNNYLNQPLVHALLCRAAINRPGGLYVIVDRGTFSAAVSLAADLERETRARFVGEPTGGAPNAPGDPVTVRLPASGLEVRVATVLWNGSDARDPRRFIAPDLPVGTTWADWLARRDPALEAIQRDTLAAAAPGIAPNTRWAQQPRFSARPSAIAW
jgi:hypothetical protein